MLRLAAASGILEVLQTGGLGAEELLGLERHGFELSAKACKTCNTMKSLRVSVCCVGVCAGGPQHQIQLSLPAGPAHPK